METPASPAPLTAALKAAFLLFTLLVLGSVAYAGCIIVRYWGETGV